MATFYILKEDGQKYQNVPGTSTDLREESQGPFFCPKWPKLLLLILHDLFHPWYHLPIPRREMILSYSKYLPSSLSRTRAVILSSLNISSKPRLIYSILDSSPDLEFLWQRHETRTPGSPKGFLLSLEQLRCHQLLLRFSSQLFSLDSWKIWNMNHIWAKQFLGPKVASFRRWVWLEQHIWGN